MRNPICLLLFLSLCSGGLLAQKADLLPPKARQAAVDRASALVGQDKVAAARLPEVATNPFDPAAGVAVVEQPKTQAAAPVRLSDDLQLRKMSSLVQPTGTISLGGEAYLLFGQKKFKVGDTIPINFEGGTYSVEVTDIQSTSFSIRFGDAETVRPIKPVTRP